MSGAGAVLLRPAAPEDAERLASLAALPEVADTLAARDLDADAIRAALAAAEAADPGAGGRLVIEADGAFAGGVVFAAANRRSRIAGISELMVDPALRGRGIGRGAVRALADHLCDGLGFHRVQAEVYGFNRAGLRLFAAAGFSREGVRRQAYWRHGAWQDGVLFGLLAEERA